MAQVSIAEAAKLVKRNRQSLYRAINGGRLSVTQSVTGERQVDTSELIRVYGELSQISDSNVTVTMLQDATPQIALLEMENRHLKERLAEKDRHLEDMRQSFRLLEDKSPKKSWWPF